MISRIHKTGGRSARPGFREALVMAVWALSLTAAARPAQDGNGPRVAKGDFRPAVVLTGSLVALRSEEFKVPVTQNWRLQIKWMAKEGDPVKPGDPVVRFDTANLASDMETAQDSLRTKREEKAQKEADYKHQQFELDVEVRKAENETRQREIDASVPEGIESKLEYDRKQLEKRKSDVTLEGAKTNRLVKLVETETQIKTLEIEVQELEARLKKLRNSLDEMTLVARTSGAVIYAVDNWSGRKVQVGDTVYSTRTVAQIPDPESLQVQAFVSETHIQQVAAGQEVDFALDAYPENRFRGVVREVAKSAEAVRRWGRSHYFRVDIEMEKRDQEIMKPGMSVRCEVRGPLAKDVLLVPLEMTAFDGQAFWIKPADGKPLKLAALGFNEFAVAASPEKNPAVKAGLALEPAEVPREAEEKKTGVPKGAGETKTDEKK
jgi:HlyD family secretion protein